MNDAGVMERIEKYFCDIFWFAAKFLKDLAMKGKSYEQLFGMFWIYKKILQDFPKLLER